MSAPNNYPHFVADQVLKANHLNDLFAYLDQENRHTRRCLIGMGIVCGLDITISANTIQISKGCGVTSEGYMLEFENTNFTNCRSYKLPDDFDPNDDTDHDYKPAYASLKMLRLIEDKDKKGGDTSLKDFASQMKDYAVMLFIERTDTDLKNCTTNDCDDKGKKIILNVLPMLVEISGLIKAFPNTFNVYSSLKLPELKLRRYNIPVKKMNSATQVLNEFLSICGDVTINKISKAYNDCYKSFKDLLPKQNSPFDEMDKLLIKRRDILKNDAVVYSQYFYDHLDDLIKAYHEFKAQATEIFSACCPSEDLFPLHILLGEANKTSVNTIIGYRHYFTYSPLFNKAGAAKEEVSMLFMRMKLLLKDFNLPDLKDINKTQIKITPSLLGREPLSQRAIPYYYEINPLYRRWNYYHTVRQNEDTILAYYSHKYTGNDEITNPLHYDLEKYNFFRIEGHIGKNYSEALTNIVSQKQKNNLPFDVIALNLSPSFNGKNSNNVNCYFSDLESMYNVILAEMLCKFSAMICPLANTRIIFKKNLIIKELQDIERREFEKTDEISKLLLEKKADAVKATTNTKEELAKKKAEDVTAEEEKAKVLADNKAKVITEQRNYTLNNNTYTQMMLFIEEMKKQKKYIKGTFIKTFCRPKKGSYGASYLQFIQNKDASLYKTAAEGGRLTAMQLYFSLFDAIEEVIGSTILHTLGNIDIEDFSDKYRQLMVVVKSLFKLSSASLDNNQLDQADFLQLELLSELQYLCLDSRIRELWFEYLKRVKNISMEKIFSNYASLHTGMEHKAGVPNGGTFILVYNDKGKKTLAKRELEGRDLQGRDLTAEEKLQKAIFGNDTAKSSMSFSDKTKTSEKASNQNEAVDAFKKLLEKNKDTYSDAQMNYMSKVLNEIVGKNDRTIDVVRIPNKVVFADFYLPYMCCSDCAPISYMVENRTTPPEETTPTIKADITEICKGNTDKFKLTVSPEGGTFILNQKEPVPAFEPLGGGTYLVNTSSLNIGTNTIEYALSNANKDALTITLGESPTAVLNLVKTPVIKGGTSVLKYTVSNVPAGKSWLLTYSVDGVTKTTENKDNGAFDIATDVLNKVGQVDVVLVSISLTNSTLNCASNLSGQKLSISVEDSSVAGTISGAVTVCKGTNTGTLAYTGGAGNIVRWELSTNNGTTYSAVVNTSTNLVFLNLTQSTLYRVVVKSGTSPEAFSTPVAVTVRDKPTATLVASLTICEATNGTLQVTVTNTFGNPWSISFLEGTAARTLAGVADGAFPLITLPLSATTNITLQSIVLTHTPTSTNPGNCLSTLNATSNIAVVPLPNATLNAVSTPINLGNAGTITFTVSNVVVGQSWAISYTEAGVLKTTTGAGAGQKTINTGVMSIPGANVVKLNSITNTGSQLACARTLINQTLTILVDSNTVAGTISGAATLCKGINNGTLTYTGGNGTIVRWEISTNGGVSFQAAGTATLPTFILNNLAQNSQFRVISKNGSAPEVASAAVSVLVRDLPTANVGGINPLPSGSVAQLPVTVGSTFGNPWSITFTEGTVTRTLTGIGDGAFTIATLPLSAKTVVALKSMVLTHTPNATNPGNCANTLASNTTVDVFQTPNATINTAGSQTCQATAGSVQFTIANVAAGQNWSLNYNEGRVVKAMTGAGSGTFTIQTAVLTTIGANVITLNSVTNTTTNSSVNLTGQSATIVVNPLPKAEFRVKYIIEKKLYEFTALNITTQDVSWKIQKDGLSTKPLTSSAIQFTMPDSGDFSSMSIDLNVTEKTGTKCSNSKSATKISIKTIRNSSAGLIF